MVRILGILFIALGIAIFSDSPRALALTASNLQISSKDTDYTANSVRLVGDVVIQYGEDVIRADQAIVKLKTQDIEATGNVSIQSGDRFMEGEKILYNYKTKVGEIHKGYVQSKNVIFMGDLIKKNSENHFVAKSARFTSCATCPPAWSFSGYEIEAEMGGYASIKYPVLRIGDIPVFKFPRIWIPLKSDRQSGILVPSLENSSRGGTAFSLPYFWAISRSQDLTYTLKFYEKRGLKQNADYRFVMDENSSGFLKLGYLKDQNFVDSGITGSSDRQFNRGFLTYQHYYSMPNGYINRANLNMSSDLRYSRDFSEEMPGHGDPALENKFSITKNYQNQHFSIESDYYINLLKSNPEANNNDSVHRMPEINYAFMQKEILNTNLFFKFDFNYVNFARKDFSYDDVSGAGNARTPQFNSSDSSPIHDGTFDYDSAAGPTDQIRTGHRYIFQPTLSYPFHLGHYLDVNPSVTYNLTEYRFNVEPAASPLPNPGDSYSRNAERQYLQTDISFKTKYSRVFGGSSEDPKATRYKHEIEPEIIHSRIPYAKRPNHIFFGDFENQIYARRSEALSNADFNGESGLQFDYKDRLFDKNLATFVLNNYLIRKIFDNEVPYYQRFITFRLAQSYDFNEAKRETDRPWSNVDGLLDIRFKNFETHSTADFYPYAGVTNGSTRLKFINDKKNYLELTYSKNTIVDENQDKTDQVTESMGTGLGFHTKYLDLVGRTNLSLITHKLESWEYVSSIKPPGDCWAIKFGHKRNIGSDTVFKFSINFDFSGS